MSDNILIRIGGAPPGTAAYADRAADPIDLDGATLVWGEWFGCGCDDDLIMQNDTWRCAYCGDSNDAEREECRGCRAPRPEEA